VLTWQAGGETAAALREHGRLVADEVLAGEMREADPVGAVVRDDDLDLTFSVARL